MFVRKERYIQMLDYIKDLEATIDRYKDEIHRLTVLNAKAGNSYYQKDSKRMSDDYYVIWQKLAEEKAKGRYKDMVIESLQAEIDRLKSGKSMSDTLRDEQGRIKSADGLSKEEKEDKALKMREAGKSDAEIREEIGINSVDIYVSNARKRLKETKVFMINGNQGNWFTGDRVAEMKKKGWKVS